MAIDESAEGFTLDVVTWVDAAAHLRAVRHAVFVVEQNVPEELEWDADDAISVHVLAHDRDGVPIACGRLLPDGRIGRMAVLSGWRGQGVGAAILSLLIDVARDRGDTAVYLHAQTHAVPFYAKFGFTPEGDEYLEAGIPHRSMRRSLITAA